MDRQTEGSTERHRGMGGQMDGQTDVHKSTEVWVGRWMDGWMAMHVKRQMDGQRHRGMGGQMDGQTCRWKDGQRYG